jgi:tetratricopeptide (TPR) repeat protein
MLGPVIGLIQVGAQSRADRYTYLPLVGATLAAIWLAGDLWPRGTAARRVAAGAAAALALSLAAVASAQIGYWRTNFSILEHTVRVTEDNFVILNNLGVALKDAGRLDEAIRVYTEVARIDPEHCNAYYNRAYALALRRRLQEAADDYGTALACYQRHNMRLDWITDTYCGLAAVFLDLGRYAEAERQLLRVLSLEPGHRRATQLLAAARARRR